MIHIRETREKDLDFVLEAENEASRTAYVKKDSKATHLKMMHTKGMDHFVVERNNQLIGYLVGVHDDENQYELRRLVIVKRNCGYGRRVIEHMIKRAFTELNCHRFWLDVRSHNEIGLHLYEKMGFIKEGVLRECVKYKEDYVSVIVMSILRREYEL